MQVNSLPAARGLAWLAEGWRLWRRNPRALMSPLPWVWLLMVIAMLVPKVGGQLVIFPWMLLQVGIYRVMRNADTGGAVDYSILRNSLRANMKGLLHLSVIVIVISLVLNLVTNAVLAGLGWLPPEPVTTAATKATAATAQAQMETMKIMVRIWIVSLIVSAPVTMVLWYSPLLVGLRGLPPVKAMFFSLVACWRNLRVFVVYVTALIVAAFALAIVGSLVSAIGSDLLTTIVMLPFMVIGLSVMFGAIYVSIKDVFGDLLVDQPAI